MKEKTVRLVMQALFLMHTIFFHLKIGLLWQNLCIFVLFNNLSELTSRKLKTQFDNPIGFIR